MGKNFPCLENYKACEDITTHMKIFTKQMRYSITRELGTEQKEGISLSEFFRILEWKAELYGREIVKVNSKDTRKTCSNCGYINHELKLRDRVFKCPVCGLKIVEECINKHTQKRIGACCPLAGTQRVYA